MLLLMGVVKEYSYKGIVMKIERIEVKQEKNFMGKATVFKSLSPCVVREHDDDTNKDWFHSLDSDKGRKLFADNLKSQLLDSIKDSTYDADDIGISLSREIGQRDRRASCRERV